MLKVDGVAHINFPFFLHGHPLFVKGDLKSILELVDQDSLKVDDLIVFEDSEESDYPGWRRCGFPDFYIKVKQADGGIKKMVIEVKPKVQCKPPKKSPKRKTKRWYGEVKTWGINEAKWKAAESYCEAKGWKWQIITEDTLVTK